MPTMNDLLEAAKTEVSNLNSDEIFMVSDLFKGYEWNWSSCNDRLIIDTLFLNYTKTHDIEVVPIEKISSGQQRYRCGRDKNGK